MFEKMIMLKDLPQEYQDSLMREFLPYSVAIGRVRDGDAKTFVPRGSGVLVSRRGRFGVLTARHCLKEKPAIEVGPEGKDTIILSLRNANALFLPPDELYEHQLVTAENEEFGPDLTFLEIMPTERLHLLRGICSFWPIDQSVDKMLETYGNEGILLASVGFPELECDTKIEEDNSIRRVTMHKTFIGSIGEGDVQSSGSWDYLTTKYDYSSAGELPESFKGVSGGPIWGVVSKGNKEDGSVHIHQRALVGISFYQTAREGDFRHIRGHFIRSIYDTMWRDFGG